MCENNKKYRSEWAVCSSLIITLTYLLASFYANAYKILIHTAKKHIYYLFVSVLLLRSFTIWRVQSDSLNSEKVCLFPIQSTISFSILILYKIIKIFFLNRLSVMAHKKKKRKELHTNKP